VTSFVNFVNAINRQAFNSPTKKWAGRVGQQQPFW
jgi:hypothetical protein